MGYTKYIKYVVIGALLVPSLAWATTSVPWTITNLTDTFISPAKINGSTKGILAAASSTIGNGTARGGLTVSGTATTTNLVVTSASTGCATFNSLGSISSTGSACVTGTISGYPFALANNATSTLTQFNGGLTAYASSTIGDGTGIGGLTVSGGATTTSTTKLALDSNAMAGVGTTTPTAKLSVHLNNNETLLNAFSVGSSTASATTTLFSIDNTGAVSAATAGFTLSNAGTITTITGIATTLSNSGWNISRNNPWAFANTNAGSGGGACVSATALFPCSSFTGGANASSYLVLRGTSSASPVAAAYIGFAQNGTEYARLDGVGNFGIGSTSIVGSVFSVTNSRTTAVGSNLLLLASTTNGIGTTTLFKVTNTGHTIASSTTPGLSSCGTNPSMVGDDTHGEVTVGSVAATACTITFATQWTVAPVCTVTNQSLGVVNAFTYTISASAITLSQTGLTGDKVDYICEGLTGQ